MSFGQALLQVRPAISRRRERHSPGPGADRGAIRLFRSGASTGGRGTQRYRLLISWRSVDHRDGFRTSDRYEEWRALAHRFYDPMPVVRYFGDPL